MQRAGKPLRKINAYSREQDAEKRLSSNISINRKTGCWEWNGFISPSGYGVMFFGGKRWLTHRLSYRTHKGPIPKGKHICHHCDNPPCCNPDHLYPGSWQDNADDIVARRQHPRHTASACRKGHRYTKDSMRYVKTSRGTTYRKCLICARLYKKRNRATCRS